MEPLASTSTTPSTSHHSSSRNTKLSDNRSVSFSPTMTPNGRSSENSRKLKPIRKKGKKGGKKACQKVKSTSGQKKKVNEKKKFKKKILIRKKTRRAPAGTSLLPSPRKLRVQIEKVDKENEILRQRVRKITDSITHTQTHQCSDLVTRLNEQADQLTINCHHEKMKIKEYEAKLKHVMKDVEKARRRYGGSTQDMEQEGLLDKQLRVLENRLEAHLKKYNKLLSINREKRKEINKLRGERKVFDEIYQKIEKELSEKQRQLSKLIENSNNAFEDRERIQGELTNVRNGIRQEERKFDEKIKIIDEILQSDVKVNMHLKQQERRKFQMSYKDQQEVTVVDQQNMKKNFIKGNWRLAEKRAKEIILKEKITRLRKIFREIEGKTFIKKEELIERLQDAQHKYYQEFMFINKLNSEIEGLEKQNEEFVKKVREIEKSKKIDPEKKRLKKVQNNISSIQDNVFMYTQKREEMGSLLKSVLPQVQGLCQVLSIKLPGLTAKSDVGMAIQQMFMRIEERTSHLMRLYFRKIRGEEADNDVDNNMRKKKKKKKRVQCGSNLPKKGKLKFQIKPPSSLNPIVNEVSGELLGVSSQIKGEKSFDLPPLTREELEKSGLIFNFKEQ